MLFQVMMAHVNSVVNTGKDFLANAIFFVQLTPIAAKINLCTAVSMTYSFMCYCKVSRLEFKYLS